MYSEQDLKNLLLNEKPIGKNLAKLDEYLIHEPDLVLKVIKEIKTSGEKIHVNYMNNIETFIEDKEILEEYIINGNKYYIKNISILEEYLNDNIGFSIIESILRNNKGFNLTNKEFLKFLFFKMPKNDKKIHLANLIQKNFYLEENFLEEVIKKDSSLINREYLLKHQNVSLSFIEKYFHLIFDQNNDINTLVYKNYTSMKPGSKLSIFFQEILLYKANSIEELEKLIKVAENNNIIYPLNKDKNEKDGMLLSKIYQKMDSYLVNYNSWKNYIYNKLDEYLISGEGVPKESIKKDIKTLAKSLKYFPKFNNYINNTILKNYDKIFEETVKMKIFNGNLFNLFLNPGMFNILSKYLKPEDKNKLKNKHLKNENIFSYIKNFNNEIKTIFYNKNENPLNNEEKNLLENNIELTF